MLGDTVAEAFSRLDYFERAAETCVRALQTGLPLRTIPDDVARRTSAELADYPAQADKHLVGLRAILDAEGSDYAR